MKPAVISPQRMERLVINTWPLRRFATFAQMGASLVVGAAAERTRRAVGISTDHTYASAVTEVGAPLNPGC